MNKFLKKLLLMFLVAGPIVASDGYAGGEPLEERSKRGRRPTPANALVALPLSRHIILADDIYKLTPEGEVGDRVASFYTYCTVRGAPDLVLAALSARPSPLGDAPAVSGKLSSAGGYIQGVELRLEDGLPPRVTLPLAENLRATGFRSLVFEGRGWGPASLGSLLALPRTSPVQRLGLRGMRVDADVAGALSAVLQGCGGVQVLSLEECALTEEALASLAEALPGAPELRHVSLRGSVPAGLDVEPLVAAFQHCSVLERIDMRNTSFNDTHARVLARSFPEWLDVLDLRDNPEFTGAGFGDIFDAAERRGDDTTATIHASDAVRAAWLERLRPGASKGFEPPRGESVLPE